MSSAAEHFLSVWCLCVCFSCMFGSSFFRVELLCSEMFTLICCHQRVESGCSLMLQSFCKRKLCVSLFAFRAFRLLGWTSVTFCNDVRLNSASSNICKHRNNNSLHSFIQFLLQFFCSFYFIFCFLLLNSLHFISLNISSLLLSFILLSSFPYFHFHFFPSPHFSPV